MKYQNENFGGIYDFRCRFHNGWIMSRHIHEYSELLYCNKGSCEILVDGKAITLCEKQFVWILPNSIHQYKQTDANLTCAIFSHDFIPLFFHMTKGKRLITKAIDSGELCDIFEKLPSLCRDNSVLICAYLNLICARVLEVSDFDEENISDGILYQKVVSYICDHFLEDISLKQLAKKFGYNEKYMSHCLHSLTNMNFTEIIAMYRIEHAKKLFQNDPKLSISDVAFACGFNAINTFNRMFKKITGMTPSRYKKDFPQ